MGVKIRINRGKIYLDIHHGGKRQWFSTGLTVPADARGKREVMAMAEEIRKKREMQIAAGRFQLRDPVASKETLIAFAERIAKEYDAKMHVPKSIRYLRDYAGTVALSDLDTRFVEGYRAFLLKQSALGPTTAQHYLAALKSILTRAEHERLIESNPTKGVKPIRLAARKKPYLTPGEIQKLYNTPAVGGPLAEQVRVAFLLSCFTGLRLGDLRGLTWGDIRRDPDPRIERIQNKTHDVVVIPLSPSAWRLIDDGKMHRNDERVFPRLTASAGVNPHQPLIAWRKRAEIDRAFGWHAGRHSFAMMTLEASGDVYSVSRLLGHSDIAITSEYLRLTSARAKAIIDTLPAINDDPKGTVIPMERTAEK